MKSKLISFLQSHLLAVTVAGSLGLLACAGVAWTLSGQPSLATKTQSNKPASPAAEVNGTASGITPSPTSSAMPTTAVASAKIGSSINTATPSGQPKATSAPAKQLKFSTSSITVLPAHRSVATITASSPDGLPIGPVSDSTGANYLTVAFDGPHTPTFNYEPTQTFFVQAGQLAKPGDYTVRVFASTQAGVRYEGTINVHVDSFPAFTVSASNGYYGDGYVHATLKFIFEPGYSDTMPMLMLTSDPARACDTSGTFTQIDATTFHFSCRQNVGLTSGVFTWGFKAQSSYFTRSTSLEVRLY